MSGWQRTTLLRPGCSCTSASRRPERPSSSRSCGPTGPNSPPRGVVLPGHHGQDHFRASQDLRGIQKLASDPAGSWTGEWEILARQAAQSAQAGKTAVISHELFSAADAEQAGRAVASLRPAEVHIVITVRDMASLLPAEWQETVKHRNARAWEDWLGDVIDTESVAEDRRQWWFWRVHDTLAIGRLWSRVRATGADPRDHDGAAGRWHQPAVAAVRVAARRRPRQRGHQPRPAQRLARAGRDRVPAAAEPGTARRDPRLVLHVERQGGGRAQGAGRPARPAIAWCSPPTGRPGPRSRPRPHRRAAGSGYDLVGDLERTPAPAASPPPAPAPPASPPSRCSTPRCRPRRPWWSTSTTRSTPRRRAQSDGRGLAGRVESAVAASPRLKRAVREISSRSAAVRRLRILVWRVMERSRTRSRTGGRS